VIPAADGGVAPSAVESSVDHVNTSAVDAPVENPGDYLTAVLNGEISTEELEVVDDELDSMIGDAALNNIANQEPLMSVKEAASKLSPGILEILAEKFKGSLTQVRHKDAQDKIF
jgi:hypothetical protein